MSRCRATCVVRIPATACLVAAVVLLPACAALHVGYEAETRISPSGKPGEYIVQFNITENLAAGATRLVSAPRLKIREGSEGEVTLGDERSSLECGAMVRRGEKGITATTNVRIKQGNKRVWTAQQSVVVTDRQPDGLDTPAPEFTETRGKE